MQKLRNAALGSLAALSGDANPGYASRRSLYADQIKLNSNTHATVEMAIIEA